MPLFGWITPRCRNCRLVSRLWASRRPVKSICPAPPWTDRNGRYFEGSVCTMRCARGSRAASGRIASRASTRAFIATPPLERVEENTTVVFAGEQIFDRGPDLLVDVAGDPLLPQLFALEREIETIGHVRRRLSGDCGAQLEQAHVDISGHLGSGRAEDGFEISQYLFFFGRRDGEVAMQLDGRLSRLLRETGHGERTGQQDHLRVDSSFHDFLLLIKRLQSGDSQLDAV